MGRKRGNDQAPARIDLKLYSDLFNKKAGNVMDYLTVPAFVCIIIGIYKKSEYVMEGKLFEMQWYLKQLYDPELDTLKKTSQDVLPVAYFKGLR